MNSEESVTNSSDRATQHGEEVASLAQLRAERDAALARICSRPPSTPGEAWGGGGSGVGGKTEGEGESVKTSSTSVGDAAEIDLIRTELEKKVPDPWRQIWDSIPKDSTSPALEQKTDRIRTELLDYLTDDQMDAECLSTKPWKFDEHDWAVAGDGRKPQALCTFCERWADHTIAPIPENFGRMRPLCCKCLKRLYVHGKRYKIESFAGQSRCDCRLEPGHDKDCDSEEECPECGAVRGRVIIERLFPLGSHDPFDVKADQLPMRLPADTQLLCEARLCAGLLKKAVWQVAVAPNSGFRPTFLCNECQLGAAWNRISEKFSKNFENEERTVNADEGSVAVECQGTGGEVSGWGCVGTGGIPVEEGAGIAEGAAHSSEVVSEQGAEVEEKRRRFVVEYEILHRGKTTFYGEHLVVSTSIEECMRDAHEYFRGDVLRVPTEGLRYAITAVFPFNEPPCYSKTC